MRRHLPPLNAIKAFEAAGRLGSFAAAAGELGVTHGAVSRQVRLLEEWMATRLFRRQPRRVDLTPDGEAYLAEVRAALEHLALATSRFVPANQGVPLRLSASHAFTMRWLMPRLPGFLRRHPATDIKLDTSTAPISSMIGRFDVAIRRGSIIALGFDSVPFLAETCVPVLSPKLQAERPLTKPWDLTYHTLVHTTSIPHLWPVWIAAARMKGLRPSAELRLDGLVVSLQAAIDGLGVAMGPSDLVQEDLAAGRLVAPLVEPKLTLEPFHVLYPADQSTHPAAWIFRDWLLDTASAGETRPGR